MIANTMSRMSERFIPLSMIGLAGFYLATSLSWAQPAMPKQHDDMSGGPLMSAMDMDETSPADTKSVKKKGHERAPHEQPGGGHGVESMMPSFEKMAQRMTEITQANEEQKKKLISLAQEGDKKIVPLRDAMKKGDDVCMQLMMASQLDLAAIKKARQAHDQNRQNIEDLRFDYWLAAMQILTPAQRQQWVKDMQAHHYPGATSMEQPGQRRWKKAAAQGNQTQTQTD